MNTYVSKPMISLPVSYKPIISFHICFTRSFKSRIAGESPYEVEEVVAGKVWAVTYTQEDWGATDRDTKDQMKAFGMDPTVGTFQEKCLAAAALQGEEVLAVCRRDIERAVRLFTKGSQQSRKYTLTLPPSLHLEWKILFIFYLFYFEGFSKETYTTEELKEVMTCRLRMFVVRLESGSLLLYTPCRQCTYLHNRMF